MKARDVVKEIPSAKGEMSTTRLSYVQGDRSVTEDLKPFATLMPVTREFVEDVPAFSSYVEQRLPTFMAHGIEDELCNRIRALKPAVIKAHGTPVLRRFPRLFPKQRLNWRLTQATAEAMHLIRATAYIEPDTIYANRGPAAGRLWGLDCRRTSGSPIVGAFRIFTGVWTPMGGELTWELSGRNAMFTRNLYHVRAEMKALPVVYDRLAFVEIDLGTKARTLFRGRVL